jgi:hypothetical protein
MFACTGRKRFISMESLWRHLKNSKTTRDAYLCLHLSVYIKNSSIHLVTQSLWAVQYTYVALNIWSPRAWRKENVEEKFRIIPAIILLQPPKFQNMTLCRIFKPNLLLEPLALGTYSKVWCCQSAMSNSYLIKKHWLCSDKQAFLYSINPSSMDP